MMTIVGVTGPNEAEDCITLEGNDEAIDIDMLSAMRLYKGLDEVLKKHHSELSKALGYEVEQ